MRKNVHVISMKYDNYFTCLYKILQKSLNVCRDLTKEYVYSFKKSTKITFSTTFLNTKLSIYAHVKIYIDF